MIIVLGLDETDKSIYIEGKNQLKINCYPFLHLAPEAKNLFKESLQSLKLCNKNAIFSTSNEVLNQDIILSERRGFIFEGGDIDKIVELVVFYKLFIRNSIEKSFSTDAHFNHSKEKINDQNQLVFKDGKWIKGLHGRYGNVELRVIDNYLRSQERLLSELSCIRAKLSEEAYMYGPQNSLRRHWLDANDCSFNLRRLITNAGFYPSLDSDDSSLHNWCNLYIDAIKNSSCLFKYPEAYPNFWWIQNQFFKDGKSIYYQNFPNPIDFYSSLEGESIIFVTPFADEINRLVASGKIFNLYKKIRIPKFSLRAVSSDISTYPNRPHESWSHTFDNLKCRVDQEMQKQSATLFFASCGCYGMPICNYTYNKFNCTSVYYGNFLNTLFGVRQNCSENFLPLERIYDNWAVSSLGDKNVNLIDQGRYVFNRSRSI